MLVEKTTFMHGLTVFTLALFVGYYVVWRVTPALHAPLMAITNAISSIVIVGGLLASSLANNIITQYIAAGAVFLAAINIIGGFFITYRMLGMFDKKK